MSVSTTCAEVQPVRRADMRRLGRWTRVLAGSAVVALLAGCGSFADLLTPGERGGDSTPAMLTFRAEIALQQATPGEVVTLDVTASYLRRDSSLVRIASHVLRLTSAALQPVPIPVDIGDCLTDPERAGTTGSCTVQLNLALVVNGTVVDRQVIGPLRLAPGQPADIAAPVTLFQLAQVGLRDTAGNTIAPSDTLELTPGGTQQLVAQITDIRDNLVTDRSVAWSSSASEVVSISESGIVTAIAEGSARVTATLGTLSASAVVRVQRPTVSLAVIAQLGSGTGRVQSTPAGIDCDVSGTGVAGACVFNFPANTEVTLQSSPADGNLFSAWGAACASADGTGSCVVQLTEALVASARFTALRQLAVLASGASDGNGHVAGPNGLDCVISDGQVSGTCAVQLPDGAEAVLTASADGALDRFAGWSGACDGSSATCTLAVTGENATVGAGFYGGRALSVGIAGNGGAVVLINESVVCAPADSLPPGVCDVLFARDTEVSLTVVPNAQSEFVEWGGACAGSDVRCTVTMRDARAVTATVRERELLLTLLVAGEGGGTVELNGEPICAAAFDAPDVECERPMRVGDTLTLRGIAAEFSTFSGFSGACSGTGECTIVADASVTVRAEFATVPASITMSTPSLSSTGSGLVMSNTTNGISCDYTLGGRNGRCSMPATLFAAVELTATPGLASVLLAWGGACVNATTTTCTVVPQGAEEVTARFTTAINVDILIPRSNGTGVVTFAVPGVPSQPVCRTRSDGERRCGYALPVGTSGVFRAEAGPGSAFVGFSGPCLEGTGPVPVCTYRGFGFVREIRAVFTTTP